MLKRLMALVVYAHKTKGGARGFIYVLRRLLEHLDDYVQRRDFRRRKIPSILLITLPKSGSMYIAHKVTESCRLHSIHTGNYGAPFSSIIDTEIKKFAIGCAVDQEHYLPSVRNLSLLKKHGIDKMVVHFRDPRQALVSWVYYFDKLFQQGRPILGSQDIDIPLDYFEKTFEEKVDIMIQLFYPLFIEYIGGWLAYEREGVPKWGMKVLFTEFGKMKSDPDAFFNEIYDFYGITPALSQGRVDVQGVNLHYRKGKLEEWRQAFTADQIDRTSAMITGEMVERFGWKKS